MRKKKLTLTKIEEWIFSYMISHFGFQTGKYSMEIELKFRAPSPTINWKAFP